MAYLIIETLGGAKHASISMDSNGNNLVFETSAEAESEAFEMYGEEYKVVEI